MKIEKLNFEEIPQLSAFDKAYQSEDIKLSSFFEKLPYIDNFKEIIDKKAAQYRNRNILTDSLKRQYEGINISEKTSQSLSALGAQNCFTVTTAHQPALLSGPLYFIYKIAGTIHLCLALKKEYPDYNFVPIYYMGSEDHDFEELNHIQLFGKKLTWSDRQGGAIGHYNSSSLSIIFDELKEILGESTQANQLLEIIDSSFKPEFYYQEAMFRFIHQLFDPYGLIVLIPDAAELKKLAISIFEDDLLQHSSEKKVNETVKALEAAGFSNQAFARPINLFYLLPGQRERIEKLDGRYRVLNTALSFSKEEILAELHLHPERFSPNVILRPLYQELILPNLAYVGGAGELAYWMERKAQFEHFNIPFPMLIRRNSLQWIDSSAATRMEKLGLGIRDIFKDTEALIKHYISQNSEIELNFAEERGLFEAIFSEMAEKIKMVDASLEASLAAQQAQLFNGLEKLETRLLRTEKQRQETAINQIKKLQEKLGLPNSLQERRENFIPLYLKYGDGLIDFLVEKLNPLQKEFLVVFE